LVKQIVIGIPTGLAEYSLLLQNKEKWFVLLIINGMDFNTTIDIILKDLREVREIIDDLKNYPGIPALQVELAKSKCKSAEEVISLLKTIKPSGEQEKKTMQVTPREVKVPETVTIPVAEDRIRAAEKLIEITSDDLAESENIMPEDEIRDKRPDSAIIADTFTARPNTVVDQFGSTKKDDDLASALKSKHVDNISDAIGINDRFLFIREIFGGSRSKYEDALGKLNMAGTYGDARAIIMSYSGIGDDNEVVKQLLEIVKRKLPSDG
jgi:hypothetical protein